MKKLPKRFQRILCSCDINKMDIVSDKDEIIIRVLNYGTWDDLKLLYKLYSEDDIKKVVSQPRRGVWLEKVLNFWMKMFDIEMAEAIYKKAIINLHPELTVFKRKDTR